MSSDTSAGGRGGARTFATTHWSVVLAARGTTPAADEALAALCRDYWYPLYAFVRREGKSPHDAQDLTQEFLARLIEKDWLAGVAPERGPWVGTGILSRLAFSRGSPSPACCAASSANAPSCSPSSFLSFAPLTPDRAAQ